MNRLIRTFIAAEIPWCQLLDELLDKLKKSGARLSVPKAEGMHVTLKFLGDIPENSVQKISDSLAKVASLHSSFEAKLIGTGCFPGSRNPRVLWVGMDDGGKLGEIAKAVDNEMNKLGFELERRPFTPHITVGRVKALSGIDGAIRILGEYDKTEFGSFKVIDIKLKKSTLTPTGAIYEDLSVIPLSGASSDE